MYPRGFETHACACVLETLDDVMIFSFRDRYRSALCERGAGPISSTIYYYIYSENMQTADTFFLLVLACLLSGGLLVAAARNGVPLTVGESHQQVLQDEGVSFVYTFNRIMEGPNKGKVGSYL